MMPKTFDFIIYRLKKVQTITSRQKYRLKKCWLRLNGTEKIKFVKVEELEKIDRKHDFNN